MTLGNYISNYLKEHKISQRQFATNCELSNGMISMLQNEKNPETNKPIKPSITTLKKIASGMGISLNELLENVDDMEALLPIEELAKNILPLSTHKKIPLLGTIACGEPIFANDNIER